MIPAVLRDQWRGLRRRVFPINLEISFTPPDEDPKITRFEGMVPGDKIGLTDTPGGHEWVTIRVS